MTNLPLGRSASVVQDVPAFCAVIFEAALFVLHREWKLLRFICHAGCKWCGKNDCSGQIFPSKQHLCNCSGPKDLFFAQFQFKVFNPSWKMFSLRRHITAPLFTKLWGFSRARLPSGTSKMCILKLARSIKITGMYQPTWCEHFDASCLQASDDQLQVPHVFCKWQSRM